MKKIFLIFVFFMIFFWNASANNYIENIFNWKKIKIIEFDTNSKDYIFKVWVNPDYNATSLNELMEKNNWVSAINWVFFCPKSYRECGGQDFTRNERYVNWLKYSWDLKTWNRVVFAWDKENIPFLFQSWKINPNLESKINYWLANHPLILQNWVDKIPEYQELWLIASNMKTKWTRNFICSTKDKSKIYTGFVFDISLPDLSQYLIDFWCYDALNLDAWATTAMIYNGRQILWPGRKLLDWIIIERKWLDTAKIIKRSEEIKEKFEQKIKLMEAKQKIIILKKIKKLIWEFKNMTYNQNSTLIFDENWKQTWYKITLNNLKLEENIYLFNHISTWLEKLLKEAEKEKIYNQNGLDLLF